MKVKRNGMTVAGIGVDHVHPVAKVHRPDVRAETAPGRTAVHLAGRTEGLSLVSVLAGLIAAPGANGQADHAASIADFASGVNRQPRCRKSN